MQNQFVELQSDIIRDCTECQSMRQEYAQNIVSANNNISSSNNNNNDNNNNDNSNNKIKILII